MLEVLRFDLDLVQSLLRLIEMTDGHPVKTPEQPTESEPLREFADAIERFATCSTDVERIKTEFRQQWATFSQEEKERCENIALRISQFWDNLTIRQKIRLQLALFPESIRRRKPLYHLLKNELLNFEIAISQVVIEESFQKGWQQVMTGKTVPLSQIWKELDDE